MSTRNFYEILNSQSNASYEELKENYKQLILQCHPDKLLQDINAHKDTNSTTTATATAMATMKAEAGNAFVNDVQENNKTDSKDFADIVDGDLNAKSDRKFVAINEAWNTLKDPTKRKLYDAEMLLTKFQTHSNVFERLTLADMEKHSGNNTINLANTNQSNDNDDDVVDVDVDENGISTSDTYYTYDCRCGGQYIVDESADNEIFNHKRSDCEVIVECNECSLVVILNG
ncbi:DPH4 homolog [Teleopsis dalmanni]|uniref:DPH4 homolog n=1 Tax=Teleopsis dalmanni TaxID=139649 RepID=UPI0018CF71D9|nr:DPH4 homolog [Teleopsis dalmanni]XP_037952089.1 DPH4 homolog [Teleopsis dalmanni]